MRRTHIVGTALGLLALGGLAARAQDAPLKTICDVQGSGAETGMTNERVAVEGVVTAGFVATDLNGFFIQDPGCDQGLSPEVQAATSNGLWVFDGAINATVAAGQHVRVTGRIDEYFGLTEVKLDGVTVLTTTLVTLPPPVALDVPADRAEAARYLEGFEGMLVDPGPIRTVGGTNHFGEGYAVPAASDIGHVIRGTETGQMLGLLFPDGWQGLNYGDQMTGAIGPLTYAYEIFKVAVPKATADKLSVVRNTTLAPERAAPSGPGELTIASYNLENFFDTIDDPGKDDIGTTPSPEHYPVDVARRARSIGVYLGMPDVVGVVEVEKIEVLEDLIKHPDMVQANYGAVLIEGNDARGIDNGLLYKRDKLRVLSAKAADTCWPSEIKDPGKTCPMADGGSGWVLYSRPPLVVRLQVKATGGRLTVVVNHFKSKSGGDAETTPTRNAQAEDNRRLMDALHAAEPGIPVVILGDLNDFPDSAPLQRLTEGGALIDLHGDKDYVAPEKDYSYIFSGVAQVLDYILVEPGFPVKTFAPVHVNADFATPADEDLSLTSPHTSDHEPVLMRVDIPPLPQGSWIYLPATFKNVPVSGPPEPTSTIAGPIDTLTPEPRRTEPPIVTPAPATPTRNPPTSTPTTSASRPRFPIRIDTIFFDGSVPRTEDDEYAQITNVSPETVSLTGWTMVSIEARSEATFSFPAAFSMTAGQTCRIYTNESHPEHCGLSWASSQAIWRNDGDVGELRHGATPIDRFCYGDRIAECR